MVPVVFTPNPDVCNSYSIRRQSTIKRTIFLNDINLSNFYFPVGFD